MHSPELRSQALDLLAEGINDCEVARRLGVPRTTVRDWRRPRYQPKWLERCPRCWRRTREMRFTSADYAALLGFYLGDGHISAVGRTFRLRLFLDARYPAVVAEAQRVIERCFRHQRTGVTRADAGSTVVPWVYSSHLPCLFPQHGPGKKHDRLIRLEGWQQAHVDVAPWAFLRGLLWSDGCSFVNRTGRYAYLSFTFANFSADIIELFARTCDAVGIEYRRYRRDVRIYRRESVAAVVEKVGLKG